MSNKFIKVTPKGETKPRFVLATLKPFYLSQGAKVEDATIEEVCQQEPAERGEHRITALRDTNAALEVAKAQLEAENAALKAQLEEAEKTTAKLRKELEKAPPKAE